MERKLGGSLCPAVVGGCVMKVRDGRCISRTELEVMDQGDPGPFKNLCVGH